MMLLNGALLCPNQHAREHANLIDLKASLKRGELLENPEEDNQQPSRVSSEHARDTEGPETSAREKSVMAPRAPRSNRRRVKEDYIKNTKSVGYDIVRAADITDIETAEVENK